MATDWSNELWRFLGSAFLFLCLGLLTGRVLAALLLGSLLYAAWQLWNLYRLQTWLRGSPTRHPPDAPPVWEDVYGRIYQMQQRNRRQKRKLGALLSKFQTSTAAMPDAIVVLGARNDIQWMNAAALRLLDLKGGDIGHPIVNLIRNPEFGEYLEQGRYEIPLQYTPTLGGDLRLAVRVIPYGADQRLLLAQDVTALHRLERVRSDFVANVSHELRTPLTVLSGFVENLQADDTDCAERWARPLALMQQQATRMQRIVNDLLLLAKLEATEGPGDTEMVDVGGMLAAIRDEARAPDASGVAEIRLEVDPRLRLSGNAQELRSAFSNLVFNAVQYTPVDGRITLRAYLQDERACVEVQDTGEGIAPEHIPRLTERFYRADVGRSRRRGGTGLGLAIVKHVMQHHGGRLEIASERGQGSLFRCVFPRAAVAVYQNGDGPGDGAEPLSGAGA
jgi:two-component system phosphate regulon sensor histidine kinase PhoR